MCVQTVCLAVLTVSFGVYKCRLSVPTMRLAVWTGYLVARSLTIYKAHSKRNWTRVARRQREHENRYGVDFSKGR